MHEARGSHGSWGNIVGSCALAAALIAPSAFASSTGHGKPTTTTTTTKPPTTTTKTTTTTKPPTTTTSTTLANQGPIANAGPDKSGTVGQSITLSGSGSSDPDGTIVLYRWAFGDGVGTDSSLPNVSHSYAAAGTYQATLTVEDNKGAWSGLDVAIVTITSGTGTTTTTTTTKAPTTTTPSVTTTTLVNQPPHANAGPDQQSQTLTMLTFNGSGSTGTISNYAWNFGDGATANGMSVTHAFGTGGTYTVTLTVTDNKGANNSDAAIATEINRPPVANAGADQSVAANTSVTLNGTGSSDPDGTIASYSWAFGDGGTAAGATVTHVYATPGTYTATLTVTDNKGATGTNTATITVSAAGPPSPWAKAIGGTAGDGAYAVAIDASGSVFVGGAFQGSMTVGTKTLTSAGASDAFIVKYSASGTVLWAKAFGGAGGDSIESLAVDPTSGAVVASGHFGGTANFGGATFVANGPQDIVLAKYDGATGAHLWSQQFGGAYEDEGAGVAVGTGGNIVLTGYFKGTASFGGAAMTTPLGVDADAFVAKFTAAGAPMWSEHFTSTGDDQGTGVAIDASGNIAISGYFTNALGLGGTQFHAFGGVPDGFVAEFTSAGTHVWSRQLGQGTPDGSDFAYGVAMDRGGNVVVTGVISGAVNLGGGLLGALGATDAYVAKYSATGAHVWSRRLGSAGNDYGFGVAVDPSDNVLVTGSFLGTGDFGGVTLAALGVMSDGFVAKYSSSGATVWARRFGGTNADTGQAIASGLAAAPVIVGYFNGTAYFDGIGLATNGSVDGFVDLSTP